MPPKISDAELITLAVMQALLGHTSEARWLRYTRSHLQHLFRYLGDVWVADSTPVGSPVPT